MDDPQIIKTPSGDELVVLPRKDYDAMVEALAEAEEELADISVLDRRKQERAASSVPDLPADLSKLLLQGRSLPAASRTWRAVTLSDLAANLAISESLLASIESGRKRGDTLLMKKLAKALDVPVEWIAPR